MRDDLAMNRVVSSGGWLVHLERAVTSLGSDAMILARPARSPSATGDVGHDKRSTWRNALDCRARAKESLHVLAMW